MYYCQFSKTVAQTISGAKSYGLVSRETKLNQSSEPQIVMYRVYDKPLQFLNSVNANGIFLSIRAGTLPTDM